MHFSNFKETRLTHNYEIIATGFTAQPSAKTDTSGIKTFRGGIELAKDITALFSSIIFSSIGYGIMVTLIAFAMEANVKNEILIAISSATQIGAGVLLGRFLPILAKKFGMIKSIYFSSLVCACCSLSMYFYVDYFIWISIVFVFGGALFITGVTRQTIMINLAPSHTKAVIISLGGMLVAIGNACGPIILETIKTSNHFTSYAIAALAYLASILPLARLKKNETKVKEEKRIGIWRYIKTSPKIMLAGFCANYSLSSTNSFLIIYGLKIGMPESEASLLYSVLLFGTVFSIPLGYLTDIVNRRFLMIACASLSLLCETMLLINNDPTKIHILLFLTFGCMTGVKLPAIVLINEKYKPTQRLAANAAFSKFCLMGNIIGIFLTGAIMKLLGPSGLWISLIAVLIFYLAFCATNYIKRFYTKLKFFKKFLPIKL